MTDKQDVISYQETTGTIRVYDEGDSYEHRDDYTGVVSVMWLDDETAYLYGASGVVKKRTLMLIFKKLKSRGAASVMVSRRNDRRMPFGNVIHRGRKESKWLIDLSQF